VRIGARCDKLRRTMASFRCAARALQLGARSQLSFVQAARPFSAAAKETDVLVDVLKKHVDEQVKYYDVAQKLKFDFQISGHEDGKSSPPEYTDAQVKAFMAQKKSLLDQAGLDDFDSKLTKNLQTIKSQCKDVRSYLLKVVELERIYGIPHHDGVVEAFDVLDKVEAGLKGKPLLFSDKASMGKFSKGIEEMAKNVNLPLDKAGVEKLKVDTTKSIMESTRKAFHKEMAALYTKGDFQKVM